MKKATLTINELEIWKPDIRVPHSPLKPNNSLKVNKLTPSETLNRDKTGTSFYNDVSSDTGLYSLIQELSERKKMRFFQPIPNIHYRECVLSKGKEWFVYFYVRNPETGKLKRIRMKVNRIRSLSERRKVAKSMMSAINQRLSLGWNPLLETKAPRAGVGLVEAMDNFIKIKTKETEEATIRSYKSYVKLFKKWMAENGIPPETPAGSINKTAALSFMDEIESSMTAKSYNNYLTFYRNLFNWMAGKGYVTGNPFNEIPKKAKRLTVKQRRVMTDDELARLWSYLAGESPSKVALCMMCYACFIRPKELVLLKCGDVDLEKHVIHIDSKVAKNDHESFRTIPDDLIPVLQRLDISEPEHYLFSRSPGRDFSPGPVKECSREIARWWSDHVREACGFGTDLQFYSLKDTGITNMLGSGIPINIVQQQADHSSVAMTAIYVGKSSSSDSRLRKVGIMENQNL